ncbi:MAG TPA: response regulator [Pararhizobium sp.]|uniref:response regulator n=1 Tax=Pararhizobium sp. TaxID=1977563 RepID=UPI002BA98A38|nr:response regulator [Pararhizobium sp.]HTO31662.1 response regulator [Pararhizobium sp.]
MAISENPLSVKRVLVLEDNFIIAMEAEDILKSIGVEHVEIATNLDQARSLIDVHSFDFAFLDVNLGNETSFEFAEVLMARGTVFGFVTGYGESSVFPLGLRDIPRITKPFNEVSMASLLSTAADPSSVGA